MGLLAGVIVVVAGVLRLGRAVTYIPWPVIEGFAPRIHKLLPGSIIAIVLVCVVAVAQLPVATIGELPPGLPMPIVPERTFDTMSPLIGAAFTVAALAAIESLLSARVAASISDTGPYDADRELVGQGLASVASGFFGGMPATGAIARTAVNVRTGGRTRLAAIVHAVLLAGIVVAGASIVAVIPLAALAGVLMVTSTRMISVATVRTVVGSTRSDAVVFVTTALITVTFDLIYAVLIGIAGAAFFALRALARSSGVHREELPARLSPATSASPCSASRAPCSSAPPSACSSASGSSATSRSSSSGCRSCRSSTRPAPRSSTSSSRRSSGAA